MVIILVENCWLPEFYYKNEGYSSKKSLDIEGEEAKDNRVWFEKKVTKKFHSEIFQVFFSSFLQVSCSEVKKNKLLYYIL